MKRLIVFCLVFFMAGAASAALISTQGESRIANAIRGIASLCDRTEESLANSYNAAKTYVLAHPTQFDTDDKTKLTNLEAYITSARGALDDLVDFVNTQFPGLSD